MKYPYELQNNRDSVSANWTSVSVLDLRRFEEVIISYGMHSPIMKEMLKLWTVCNRIITKDGIDMVKANWEPGLELQ